MQWDIICYQWFNQGTSKPSISQWLQFKENTTEPSYLKHMLL